MAAPLTEFDLEFPQFVLEEIEAAGRTVTARIPTKTPNPLTGKVPTTWTPHEIKCIPPMPFDQKYVDGDVIRTGDLETYIAAKDLPFTPDLSMRVLDSGVDWEVVHISTIPSGNLTAAYRLVLRR